MQTVTVTINDLLLAAPALQAITASKAIAIGPKLKIALFLSQINPALSTALNTRVELMKKHGSVESAGIVAPPPADRMDAFLIEAKTMCEQAAEIQCVPLTVDLLEAIPEDVVTTGELAALMPFTMFPKKEKDCSDE